MIDLQNGFINNDYNFIKKIEKLLCNEFDKIIFTRFINKKNSIFEKQLNWSKMIDKKEQEIAINSKDYKVIVKEGYSAITQDFINYIKENNIDTFFLCGLDTDACILKTALDIFELGLTPIVLKKYCKSSGGKKYHKFALDILKRNIGKNNII